MDPHNQPSSQSSTQTTQKAHHGAPHAAAAAHEQNPPNQPPHLGPDDLWEISCNDTVLPPNMTLAVVRQYVWRQSGEVVLYYRRKRQATHGKDHTV
jgi:WD repeat-containing protein 48